MGQTSNGASAEIADSCGGRVADKHVMSLQTRSHKMRRAAKPIAWLIVPLVAAVGCGAKGKTGEATSEKPPIVKTQFDTEKEPAITAETRFAAGQLAESQNNPAVAIKQYEEALRLKSDHVAALYRLGVVQ